MNFMVIELVNVIIILLIWRSWLYKHTSILMYLNVSHCSLSSWIVVHLHQFLFPYPTIHSNRHLVKQVGFKMFLGVTASVTNWDSEGTSCSLILEDNPLVDFVELPDTCQGLYYCNILSGVVRGALEMVRYASLPTC